MVQHANGLFALLEFESRSSPSPWRLRPLLGSCKRTLYSRLGTLVRWVNAFEVEARRGCHRASRPSGLGHVALAPLERLRPENRTISLAFGQWRSH